MALEPEAYGAGLGRMELKPIGEPLGFRPFDLSFKVRQVERRCRQDVLLVLGQGS
jgi:hypothetical protein